MAKNTEHENEMEDAARLAIIEHDVNEIKISVGELVEEVMKGNGRPSLKSRMSTIERYIDRQEKLADEKRADSRKLKLLIAGAWISLILTQLAMRLLV